MNEIFCLAEHRRGKIREITFEMLGKAQELSKPLKANVCAVVLGFKMEEFAQNLKEYADKVLIVEDEGLTDFNSDIYQHVLASLILERKPIVTMIGHTAFGVELAPSLAVQTDIPIAMDCIDLEVDESKVYAIRQIYSGKVNAMVSFSKTDRYMVTIRQGVFRSKDKDKDSKGEVIRMGPILRKEFTRKRFVKYIEPKVAEIDITRFDTIVSVGRGIRKREKLSIVEELAEVLGGVLACSRPIVDAGWLSVDRQIGQSGKTVKPNLIITVGISGAFQHILGMKGSENIVAINNDPGAPIFNFSDYGVVDDLFKMLPSLCDKIKEEKGNLLHKADHCQDA